LPAADARFGRDRLALRANACYNARWRNHSRPEIVAAFKGAARATSDSDAVEHLPRQIPLRGASQTLRLSASEPSGLVPALTVRYSMGRARA
jgi:hypothetical protein